MDKGEFALAKIKHQTWRLRLRSFLMGSNGVREVELTSPRECALGKWIYSEALSKYGTLPEMQQLERDHIRIHELAERLVRSRKATSLALANDSLDFQAFQILSDQLIGRLTAMGEKFTS
jgi:methyl-accepting chemotaxis protein